MAQNDKTDEVAEIAEIAETEEALQAKLKTYQEALDEEFTEAIKSRPEQAAQITRDYYKENMPLAGATLVFLCQHAESEAVRLSAAKYINEQGKEDATSHGDPIQNVIDKLTKQEAS